MNSLNTILIISVLGPIIGSFIGVIKSPSKVLVYNMLSFSAGVMIAISFLELIPESLRLSSTWITVLGILIGSIIMLVIDKLIPHFHISNNPKGQKSNLSRTSTYLLVGIFLHNFPEGMAIGFGSISGVKSGLIIALAIAVHNIPEGICTSAPYYYCVKNRLRAFLVSSSTALPILLGFIFSHYLFQSISEQTIGLIGAITAGIMIHISAEELIPSSCCKLTNHTTIFSFTLGVIFVILLGLL